MKRRATRIVGKVNHRLAALLGGGKIGRLRVDPTRLHEVEEDLDASYAAMAADRHREADASEWMEGITHNERGFLP